MHKSAKAKIHNVRATLNASLRFFLLLCWGEGDTERPHTLLRTLSALLPPHHKEERFVETLVVVLVVADPPRALGGTRI